MIELIYNSKFPSGTFVCRKSLFSELNDHLVIEKIDARLSN